MHANPDDDFCDPKVGMNESIVDKYIQEGEKIVKEGGECFEEPIMVAKLSDGDYMIINGHHRWAAAIKMGLDRVRVVIANPGEENLVGFLKKREAPSLPSISQIIKGGAKPPASYLSKTTPPASVG